MTAPGPPPEAAPSRAEPGERLSSTARTEAFSDGVFAIAITLLVLEVRVPTPAQVVHYGGLLPALLHGWASYLGYLVTFLTVGVIWLNHHAGFARIAQADVPVLWFNLLILLGVSFTPFPNALLTEYLPSGLFSEAARTAACVYALVFVFINVMWVLLWGHLAAVPRLLEAGTDAAYARRRRRRVAVGAGVYGLCAVVAILAPIVSLALFLAAACFYALTTSGPRKRG